MADLTLLNENVPTDLEDINNMPARVRALASAFKESFELDHSFGTSVDTTEIDCDGYHKQLTMPEFSGFDSETGNPITEPEQVTDGAFLFTKKIDGEIELCCQNETGAYQMTSKGYIATDVNAWEYIDDLSGSIFHTAYLNNLFIAVGTYIWTSTDGITWTNRLTCPSGYFRRVIFGNNLFIAIGTYYIYTSSDGINWTQVFSVSTSYNIYSIDYNGSIFVAVGAHESSGESYGRIWNSVDGTTWSLMYSCGSALSSITDIAYGNSLFVAISSTGYYYFTSPDGTTWTQRSDISDCIFYGITFYNNLFIIGASKGRVYTSADGINFTLVATLGSNNDRISKIIYGIGLYFLNFFNVTVDNKWHVYYSKNLVDWELSNFDPTPYENRICFANYKTADKSYTNSFFLISVYGVINKTQKYIEVT